MDNEKPKGIMIIYSEKGVMSQINTMGLIPEQIASLMVELEFAKEELLRQISKTRIVKRKE